MDTRGRVREDPAPFDGEPERVRPQPTPRELDVLAVAAPVAGSSLDQVAADPAALDVRRVVAPDPPVAARIRVRRAPAGLGLERADRGAPEELRREVARRGCPWQRERQEEQEQERQQEATQGEATLQPRPLPAR